VRVWRVLALAAVVGAGVGVALIVPVLTTSGRERLVRGWFRAVVAAVGVRLVVTGTTRPGPVLVAANHLSWLDIPAILAVQPMRVLAKSELRRWPVLGLLAARGGTLFIDRNRLRRLPATVAEIAATLRNGDSVLVFPEGSTWCGRPGGDAHDSSTRRVHPATMQAAIDAGVRVRPVALRYRLADGTPTTVAAFVGTDSMLASVWRIAAIRGVVVDVQLRPLVDTDGLTRRATAETVARRIRITTPEPSARAARRRARTVRRIPARVDSGQSRHLAFRHQSQ
jgi:1-acyl-sn-glycerol-3-phosphate acyltransferase